MYCVVNYFKMVMFPVFSDFFAHTNRRTISAASVLNN
jgi:hypothetical protein